MSNAPTSVVVMRSVGAERGRMRVALERRLHITSSSVASLPPC